MESIEVHRIGFTQLFEDISLSQGAKKIHIVFLHGLRGHPKHTWEGVSLCPIPKRKEKWTFKFPFRSTSASSPSKIGQAHRDPAESRKVFWLHEFLASDIPEATIWTYGYNADVIGGIFGASNKNSARQHGEDLAVRIERDISGEEPIVFVAHSLGGIVVKYALFNSETCRKRTKMIVFMGTPHRGSSFATWGQIAANLALLALQDTNKALLETLEVNSAILDNIHAEFSKIALECQIRIHSFQEGRGMSGFKGLHNKIVEDGSSKTGLERLETLETIDADHRQIVRCSSRTDQQYRAVRGVLREFVDRIKLTEKSRFLVPYDRNEGFIGRISVLEILRNRSLNGPPQPRLGLFGLGGIGKTQIALQYVHWLRETRPEISIFWVHAANAERFHHDYVSIARNCRIPGCEEPTADVPLLVKRWLKTEGNGRWLMVLDNADNMELFYSTKDRSSNDNCACNLAQYIPECLHGTLLITSRDKKTALRLTNDQPLIEVKSMDKTETEDLLRSKLQEPDLHPSVLSTLSFRLEYLPLAIVQAAMFIVRNNISVHQYLLLLDDADSSFVELLSEEYEVVGKDSQTPGVVTSTWILSFEQLQQQNEFAAALLSLMSCFDRQAIPLDFLSRFRSEYRDITSPGNSQLGLVFGALGVLKGFSFISEDNNHHFNMHRLIQLVTQKWLARKGKLEEFSHLALQIVSETYPPKIEDPKNWSKCSAYLAHAFAVFKFETGEARAVVESRACLLERAARFLDNIGRYSPAEQLYNQALAGWRTLEGDKSSHYSLAITLIAGIYGKQGRYAKAESLQLEWLEAISDVFEKEHPGEILHKCIQAGDYHRQGSLKEADRLQAEVLEKAREMPRNGSVVTWDFILGLSITFRHQDRLREAEILLLYILTSIECLGIEHDPTAAHAMSNLAALYQIQGRSRQSIELTSTVLKEMERIYGENHPNTIQCKSNLAKIYWKEDRFTEAEPLLVEAYESTRTISGDDHPDTINRMINVGAIYVDLNRLDDGEAYLTRGLRYAKDMLGEEHPDTLFAVKYLGVLYMTQCQYDKGEKLYRQAWEADSRILGEGHRTSLESLNSLAIVQYSMGKFQESEALFQNEFEIRKRLNGEENRETIKSLNWLAKAQHYGGKVQEARSTYRQVLALKKKIDWADGDEDLQFSLSV